MRGLGEAYFGASKEVSELMKRLIGVFVESAFLIVEVNEIHFQRGKGHECCAPGLLHLSTWFL